MHGHKGSVSSIDSTICIERKLYSALGEELSFHGEEDNMADVETEDISQFFNSSYEFIEQARVDKTGIAPVSFYSEPWPRHRGNEETRPDWHITHSHSPDFLTV